MIFLSALLKNIFSFCSVLRRNSFIIIWSKQALFWQRQLALVLALKALALENTT